MASLCGGTYNPADLRGEPKVLPSPGQGHARPIEQRVRVVCERAVAWLELTTLTIELTYSELMEGRRRNPVYLRLT